MEIIHKLGDRAVKKEGEGYFLLTDKLGGFLSLGSLQNISHMQGLFHLDNNWNMYKTLENIYPDKELTALENKFSHVIRHYDKSEEVLHLSATALIYEIKHYEGFINLDLDFRNMFDFDDKDRFYEISHKNDLLIIYYKKHNKYMAIKGVKEFESVDKWEHRAYPYDKNRNDVCEFYIYKAIKINCHEYLKLFISSADSKEEAVNNVKSAFRNESIIKESLHLRTKHTCRTKDFAVNVAIHSLDSLRNIVGKGHNKLEGVFAGLPWFYQFWSRDELISIKSFMIEEKFHFVKKRLDNYLNDIDENGRLINRIPRPHLGAADSIGWLFKRIYDFILILKKKNCLKDYYTKKELEQIKHQLHFSIEEHMVRYMKEYIIYSELNENWMDTHETETEKKDGRPGACIEIQALFLSGFKLMKLLCNELKLTYLGYETLEKLIANEVKIKFFQKGNLQDVLGDNLIRPNIFIAYYVYPELLKKHEWKIVFNKTLRALWLEWGGLATIDKRNAWYRPYYTGKNNFSYHRGDSWFWINNLAAICMHDLDKQKYKHFIDNIFASSEKEMFFSGYIGHCAEISSAAERKSEGCMAQAWSAALFVELAQKKRIL